METAFIDHLRCRLPPHPCLRIGPGDDAAVLALGDRAECVVTVDLLTDGVDFILSEVDPRRVGHKALGVNLSDLAAMAAQPVAVVVALALPRQGASALGIALYEGLLPLAERFGVAIAGGDTNTWDGPLAISITAIGQVSERGPLLRSGAQPGDRILVTGRLGGSILGRHLDVEPRIEEALALHQKNRLHAGIDLSDGLSTDLGHLARESRCGAVLRSSQIPIASAAVELSNRPGDPRSPLEHALHDGEDFELLFAVAPGEAQRILDEQPLAVEVTDLGEFVDEPGLWIVDEDSVGGEGRKRELIPQGFEHRME